MARMVCPTDPTHNRFITTAHESHDWIVDGEGEFQEDLGCIDIFKGPDITNIWTCVECDAEAERV